MKPWLIGESNPYGGDQDFALYPEPKGCAGWRLCHNVLQMEPHQYRAAFVRRNLLEGDRWSAPKARQAAEFIYQEAMGAPLVLLGAKVAAAFGMPFKPFTVCDPGCTLHRSPLLILPHPSGLSRGWNERGAYQRAQALIMGLIREAA